MNQAILLMSTWVALWAAFASLAANRRKPKIEATEMARQIVQDQHEVWHARVEQAIRHADPGQVLNGEAFGYSTAVDIGMVAPKEPVRSWCAGCDELPDVQTMAFTDDGRWRCAPCRGVNAETLLAAAGVLTPNEARA